MCKFNNRLFNFALIIIVVINQTLTLPVNRKIESKSPFLDYIDYDQNYDLHYDQRQNGTENYRINLNGFLIGFPSEEVTNNSDLVAAFENELLGLIDKYENDPLQDDLIDFGENQTEHTNDYSGIPKPEASQAPTVISSSAKGIHDRYSDKRRAKPDKPNKLRLHIANFLRLLRRNSN